MDLGWGSRSDKQTLWFVFPSPVTMVTRKEIFSCHYERYGEMWLRSTGKTDGF